MGVVSLNLVIKKCIDSNIVDMKYVLDNIVNSLKEVLYDRNILLDTKLILDELISNGVMHGNRLDEKKKVEVYVKVSDEYIRIEVSDEGNGFVYDKDSYDPMKLSCGGRGLRIVDGLSDEFSIQKNKVISIKYL